MKNKKSIYTIVAISLFVGLLHFITGPDYRGLFRDFVRGYLIDILLPMDLYLLLQLTFRQYMSVNKARITSAIFTFTFGAIVELLQFYKIEFLGRTYDPMDILMYGIGIGLGFAIDLTIIDKFEKQKENHK